MIFENYESLLERFLNKSYKFIFFPELQIEENRQIILRHDVDLDLDLAFQMAKIENSLGIKSTYFFLLRTDSYNLISDTSADILYKFKELGHSVSLHFDMLLYENIKDGLEKEREIFAYYFDTEINIISIHRPNDEFLKNPEGYFNVENTYEKMYSKDIQYFSDSEGSFRFGYPTNSNAFENNKNIQLLIHPVWWTTNGNNVINTVNKVIYKKSKKLELHFKKNIKTFR
ncbi:hypothetical protein OAV00_01785 [Candidatus Marinimicrobia bacterium]|nr:hypothetical protein [Candidatus Neomarinimicrobiota bacterium]